MDLLQIQWYSSAGKITIHSLSSFTPCVTDISFDSCTLVQSFREISRRCFGADVAREASNIFFPTFQYEYL